MRIIVSLFESFNTQPPEGGWMVKDGIYQILIGFNTQPPEGGWDILVIC